MGNPDDVQVTNDGATILKSLFLDNPAAKVLVDIARVQGRAKNGFEAFHNFFIFLILTLFSLDDEVGDGTTSVCVLTAEFLREAEKLVQQKVCMASSWTFPCFITCSSKYMLQVLILS